MSQEKANPIPPGVYWVDVVRNEDRPGFEKWLKQNAKTVKVIERTDKGKQSAISKQFGLHSTFGLWVLFEVTEPTSRWPKSVRIGLPNRAKKGKATKKADTVKREKPKGVAEYWGDSAKEFFTSPGGLILALAVLVMMKRK